MPGGHFWDRGYFLTSYFLKNFIILNFATIFLRALQLMAKTKYNWNELLSSLARFLSTVLQTLKKLGFFEKVVGTYGLTKNILAV